MNVLYGVRKMNTSSPRNPDPSEYGSTWLRGPALAQARAELAGKGVNSVVKIPDKSNDKSNDKSKRIVVHRNMPRGGTNKRKTNKRKKR